MRKRIATYLFFFSLLVLGGGYAMMQWPVLKVSYVEVIGSDKLAAVDVPVAVGDNLLKVDMQGIINGMMRHNFVATAAVKADQYGKITVNLTEKTPVSFIYLNRLYGISRRCELLPADLNSDAPHLPIIRGVQVKNPVQYSFIDNAGLRAAVNLIETMKAKYPRSYETLSELVLEGDRTKLIFEPGSIVVEFGWGDVDKKIQRIETILESNKNPGLDIDLRFANVAVLKSRLSKDREVTNGI